MTSAWAIPVIHSRLVIAGNDYNDVGSRAQ
jgi:hypothetical protein